jgi:hypothetical protein
MFRLGCLLVFLVFVSGGVLFLAMAAWLMAPGFP